MGVYQLRSTFDSACSPGALQATSPRTEFSQGTGQELHIPGAEEIKAHKHFVVLIPRIGAVTTWLGLAGLSRFPVKTDMVMVSFQLQPTVRKTGPSYSTLSNRQNSRMTKQTASFDWCHATRTLNTISILSILFVVHSRTGLMKELKYPFNQASKPLPYPRKSSAHLPPCQHTFRPLPCDQSPDRPRVMVQTLTSSRLCDQHREPRTR